jgi:hypothetical protein
MVLARLAAGAVPQAAAAGPARCAATPVHGRDGTVLYWTGGAACATRGRPDHLPATDHADGDAGPGDLPTGNLTPETRPDAAAEVVAG